MCVKLLAIETCRLVFIKNKVFDNISSDILFNFAVIEYQKVRNSFIKVKIVI